MIFLRGGVESQCEIGYEGILCQNCDIVNGITYSKKGESQCIQCYEETILIILAILILACFFGFFYVFLK